MNLNDLNSCSIHDITLSQLGQGFSVHHTYKRSQTSSTSGPNACSTWQTGTFYTNPLKLNNHGTAVNSVPSLCILKLFPSHVLTLILYKINKKTATKQTTEWTADWSKSNKSHLQFFRLPSVYTQERQHSFTVKHFWKRHTNFVVLKKKD